jgi:hypothetical protein
LDQKWYFTGAGIFNYYFILDAVSLLVENSENLGSPAVLDLIFKGLNNLKSLV